MIIPILCLYKDYLEIEKQIYSILEITDFLTNELYSELFDLELRIRDHPKFDDFKVEEIQYLQIQLLKNIIFFCYKHIIIV